MSRQDHPVVWPVLIFVGAIVGLLALDDALWGLFESASALYGPLVLVPQISGSRDQVHLVSIQLSTVFA